jgi:hypothetical protein
MNSSYLVSSVSEFAPLQCMGLEIILAVLKNCTGVLPVSAVYHGPKKNVKLKK